jgi:hypothetical protein
LRHTRRRGMSFELAPPPSRPPFAIRARRIIAVEHVSAPSQKIGWADARA